jgi:squalene synthase HpnC/squalene synthase HpnD
MAYSFAAHLARYGPQADYPVVDLAAARSYCARLTRSHYENFTVISALLPRRLVPHFHAIYAYCRWADDLADETGGGQQALDLLEWWRQELLNCYQGKSRHPVMVALRLTIERFAIPSQPFLDLITAFEQDQDVQDYASFDDLLLYCQHSANPVGRLILYLLECFNEQTAALADSICTGLQLANFWQDVRRDYVELGRVYLPEHDRIAFKYDDEDLAACRFTPQFRELMRVEVNRAREYLERGRPLLELVPDDVRVDIELFLEGGLAILRKIEAIDFDVWKSRPRLSKREKAQLLLRALRAKPGVRGLVTAFGILGTNHIGPPQPPSFGLSARSQISVSVDESPHSKFLLPASYIYCHQLTRVAARNFYYAFQVLPRQQRKATEALYAFMRVTDDLADEPGEVEVKRIALNEWRQRLERALKGEYSHPLHPALHDIVRRFEIPPQYLYEAIEGATMDLEPVRFAGFDELYRYCYRVASTVGLACIHIWGFADEKGKEYAEAAGIAFQLTNILRDLGEDLDRGRIYLPQEDWGRFDCPPEMWRQRGNNFRRMMIFQAERARSYFRKSAPLAGLLTPAGQAVFGAMTRIYRGLLEKIERLDYDVFTRRVRLSRWQKLRALLLAFPVRWGWL